MLSKLIDPVTVTWLVLFAGTVASWFISPRDELTASLGIGIALLTIALFKVRLILLYFMELRFAPQPWRGIFEAWVFAVWATLVALLAGMAPF